MKKLSEYKDEDALDLLADLLSPTVEIFADAELRGVVKDANNKLEIAQYIIKNHKSETLQMLAILNGVPREDYHCNPASVLVDLMSLLNDKDLIDFFKSQGLMAEEPSGPATETTEEIETK